MTFPAKSSIQGMGIRDARFRTDFVAKTQNPSVPDDWFESFTIPSLMDFTAFDAKEMLPCPQELLRGAGTEGRGLVQPDHWHLLLPFGYCPQVLGSFSLGPVVAAQHVV